MIRAGLTGGLACGKGFVGGVLESLGCFLVRADDLGHRVMSIGGEAYEPVIRHFGKDILESNGEINRKRLAAKVFGDPERLVMLNGLIHPAVFRLEEQFFAEVQSRHPHSIAVVEAAILVETGSYRKFDRLIVIVCTEEQQIARAVDRDGCTPEEVVVRLQRQMPLSEKRKYADYVIDSSGTKQETISQVQEVYKSLRALADAQSRRSIEILT